MRPVWRLIALIALVLALVATLITAIFSGMFPTPIFPDVVSLPLVLVELVGIVWATLRVRSVYGLRTAIVVAIASFVLPVAGSIAWLVTHTGTVVAFVMQQIRTGALAATTGPAWTEQRVADAVVRYQPQDPGAPAILAVMPEALARVQAAFPEFPGNSYVLVFPDRKIAQTALNTPVPDGGTGDGFGPDLTVMVSPAAWSAEDRALKPVNNVVTHELTHNAVAYSGGAVMPKWLTEGIAIYVGHQVLPSQQQVVAQLAASGKLYSLQDLDKLFSGAASTNEVGPGHALAGNLVNFMVDRYSFAKVKQVVADLGKGQTIDQALTDGIGTGSKGLESAWHQWLLAGGQ